MFLFGSKCRRLTFATQVEFIGQIEPFYDRGNNNDFTALVHELAPAGILTKSTEFEFNFANVIACCVFAFK